MRYGKKKAYIVAPSVSWYQLLLIALDHLTFVCKCVKSFAGPPSGSGRATSQPTRVPKEPELHRWDLSTCETRKSQDLEVEKKEKKKGHVSTGTMSPMTLHRAKTRSGSWGNVPSCLK